ncbi:MAG: hypothetical protein IPI03_16505 [Rubrivivax sp.]|jgi:uncharacterized membrane protein|nr:hypothetical protein [Rubrivivax sp.]MBK8528819.1 hypothetical protein [Rubrivivax sp.]
MTVWVDLGLAAAALALALVLRPWRALVPDGPPWPWPWLAWAALLPLFWTVDRVLAMPVMQPLSGACLLVLLMGWPMAMLALLPVALLAAWLAGLDAAEAMHRAVWLGVVPGTLALLFGLALRRWLPHHVFVFILGRAFFGTALCTAAAGIASSWLHGMPGGLVESDLMLARWLAAWGDAWLCGMIVAIFVAFRPQWLATYTDRLYLSTRPDS